MLSLSETPYSWQTGANRVMLLRDGPAAQIALWCGHWTAQSSARREVEILVRRQQINVASRQRDWPSTTPIVCCSSGCLGWFRQRLRHWR